MRFLALLAAIIVCLAIVQASLVVKGKNSRDVSGDDTRVCTINCSAYANKATGKKICSSCKNNGKLDIKFVGQKCPTLEQVQNLLPADQVKVLSQVAKFCRKSLKCKCAKIDLNNSGIIAEE
jgi:hypothetical protein